MIFYNVACYGDSQTFGARSYGCYPVYLADLLKRRAKGTEYRTINRSVNGYTARDLWFKLNEEIDTLDASVACLMVGTNDVRKMTPVEVYGEYVRQMILAFQIKGYQHVFVGGIPPIVKQDFDPWYPQRVAKDEPVYQRELRKVVKGFGKFCTYVPMSHLTEVHYEDSVHFNERGNWAVADRFADYMVAR